MEIRIQRMERLDNRMRYLRPVLTIIIGVVFLTGAAWSQTTENGVSKGFGVRAGYGTNPDQFVFGAQSVLEKTLGFMRFAPSIDIGVGSDMTTYLFNADFRMLSFSPPGSPAGIYAGAGGAIALLNAKQGGNDTEVGLNAVVGLALPMGSSNEYNMEVRFGFGDMPDLRVLFGVMFGGRSKTNSSAIEIRR